jgi:hypothetical protein
MLQIGLLGWVEETPELLDRKPHVLEAGASSTLFTCENCVRFWKEYFLQFRFCKLEFGSLCSKQDYSVEVKKHVYLSKENHVY